VASGIADPNGSSVPIRERTDIAYLLLDGLRRSENRKSKEAILCALALAKDVSLVPLLMRPVARETERAWRGFLGDLKSRGVGKDLRLICCDDHPALLSAVGEMFPDTPVQISVAHRLLTLSRKVESQFRAACLAEARQIFAAPDLDTAVARFRTWRAQWGKHGHRAVNSLEADLASCLTFYRFPSTLWSKIRTVNLVEREFRQARRTAPPAPADETDQEPAAGATGPLMAGVSVPAGGPAVDDPGDLVESSMNGHSRQRRHQLKSWNLAPTAAFDRVFQGDPRTESFLTYQVPAVDTAEVVDTPANGLAYPFVEEAAGVAAESLDEQVMATPDRVALDDAPIASEDYPISAAHAYDLTQDADFMWWLRQHRQVQALPVPAVIIATVLGGLLTGLLLARGL
jgi:hypothetical protein